MIIKRNMSSNSLTRKGSLDDILNMLPSDEQQLDDDISHVFGQSNGNLSMSSSSEQLTKSASTLSLSSFLPSSLSRPDLSSMNETDDVTNGLTSSASTNSLADYVNSSTLLKSPSTSSLSQLHKSASASSLSNLHTASLLKSSSSSSFSKFQEELERDEMMEGSQQFLENPFHTATTPVSTSSDLNQQQPHGSNTNHGDFAMQNARHFKQFSEYPDYHPLSASSISNNTPINSNGIDNQYHPSSFSTAGDSMYNTRSIDRSITLQIPNSNQYQTLQPPLRIETSSPTISTFEQFNQKQAASEQPIANPSGVDPNLTKMVKLPTDYTMVDGQMYNDRGYKICGHMNQHNRPCQRIGRCPFHYKLKPGEEDEAEEGDGEAIDSKKKKRVKIEDEEESTEQKRATPTHTPPVKKGPYKQGWSKEEHILFLKGLKLHGKGAWKEIATIVGTRTPTQIQSHAQKYFLRQKQKNKNKRSIHDITMDDLKGEGANADEDESDSSDGGSNLKDRPRTTNTSQTEASKSTSSNQPPTISQIPQIPQENMSKLMEQADVKKMATMFPNVPLPILLHLISLNNGSSPDAAALSQSLSTLPDQSTPQQKQNNNNDSETFSPPAKRQKTS